MDASRAVACQTYQLGTSSRHGNVVLSETTTATTWYGCPATTSSDKAEIISVEDATSLATDVSTQTKISPVGPSSLGESAVAIGAGAEITA